MELFKYYSLDECSDIKIIRKRLAQLKSEGKVDFEIENDVLTLVDLDLVEDEMEELIEMFDKYDAFPYPEYDQGDSDDEDYLDYYDDDDDY